MRYINPKSGIDYSLLRRGEREKHKYRKMRRRLRNKACKINFNKS